MEGKSGFDIHEGTKKILFFNSSSTFKIDEKNKIENLKQRAQKLIENLNPWREKCHWTKIYPVLHRNPRQHETQQNENLKQRAQKLVENLNPWREQIGGWTKINPFLLDFPKTNHQEFATSADFPTVQFEQKKETPNSNQFLFNLSAKARFLCAFCENQDFELKKCLGCQSVVYCNKTCQKKDWFNHRFFCIQTQLRQLQQVQKKQEQSSASNLEKEKRKSKKRFEKIRQLVNKNIKLRKANLKLKKKVKELKQQNERTSEKGEKELEEFLALLKHIHPKWHFCIMGNCFEPQHLCLMKCVPEEMDQNLKKRASVIFLNEAQYSIVYHSENSATQTRITTKQTRKLSLRTVNSEIRTCFTTIFGSHYWKNCSEATRPYISVIPIRKWRLAEILPFTSEENLQAHFIYNRSSFEVFKGRCQFWSDCKSEKKNNILFLFHGLKNSNTLQQIVEDGFQLHYSQPGAFSRGFYFSESFTVAWNNYHRKSGSRKTGWTDRSASRLVCQSSRFFGWTSTARFVVYTTNNHNYITNNDTESKSPKKVLLCAVNVGTPFLGDKRTSWNRDHPCVDEHGKLLQSVQFEHFGSLAYVVPLNQQIHPLAVICQLNK